MAWKNEPAKVGLKLLGEADKFTKRIAGEILQKVVVASPVDTGQFRNNWRVAINTIDISTDAVIVDKTGQGAISRGLSTIASGGGLGKIVSISNSLHYSIRLNNGWSDQAPIGFVDLELQSVLNKYR